MLPRSTGAQPQQRVNSLLVEAYDRPTVDLDNGDPHLAGFADQIVGRLLITTNIDLSELHPVLTQVGLDAGTPRAGGSGEYQYSMLGVGR
jgi:hypothetical protein